MLNRKYVKLLNFKQKLLFTSQNFVQNYLKLLDRSIKTYIVFIKQRLYKHVLDNIQ